MTFKTKTRFYLKLLTSETMKLIGTTKSNITKDEKGKNVSRLEISEVVIIQCNIVNNYYQQISRVFIFLPNNSFGQLLDISPKNFMCLKTLTRNFHILKYCLLVKILNHLS